MRTRAQQAQQVEHGVPASPIVELEDQPKRRKTTRVTTTTTLTSSAKITKPLAKSQHRGRKPKRASPDAQITTDSEGSTQQTDQDSSTSNAPTATKATRRTIEQQSSNIASHTNESEQSRQPIKRQNIHNSRLNGARKTTTESDPELAHEQENLDPQGKESPPIAAKTSSSSPTSQLFRRVLQNVAEGGTQTSQSINSSGTASPALSPAVVPQVFNRPVGSTEPHSLVQVSIDMYAPGNDTPKPRMTLAYAVPTHLILPMLKHHSSHPSSRGTELEQLMTRHLVVTQLLKEDMNNTATANPNDVDMGNHNDTNGIADTPRLVQEPIKPTPRKSALKKRLEKARSEREKMALTMSKSLDGPTPGRVHITRTVPDAYVDGKLFLGRKKTVTFTVDIEGKESPTKGVSGNNTFPDGTQHSPNMQLAPYVDEEQQNTTTEPLQGLSSTLQMQNESSQQQTPRAPQARGWGLSSLLSSAQSVSKFIPIPFTSRRGPSTPRALSASFPADPKPLNFNEPNPHPVVFTPRQPLSTTASLGAHYESSRRNDDIEMTDASPADSPSARLAKRNHKARPKKQLQTKAEVEEEKKRKKELQERKAYAEKVEQEKARWEQEKMEMQRKHAETETALRREIEEARKQAEAAQVPGSKRKRSPSPDVIPNPVKNGYGMDLKYFGYSDDEFDEVEVDAATACKSPNESPRSAKRSRMSGPEDEVIIGDPHNAQPYTGKFFADPNTPPKALGGNVFGEAAATERPAHLFGISDRRIAKHGADFNFEGHFKCPSPSDTDYEETTFMSTQDGSFTEPASPEAASHSTEPHSKQAEPRQSATQLPKPIAPPPPPEPRHASLPASITTSPIAMTPTAVAHSEPPPTTASPVSVTPTAAAHSGPARLFIDPVEKARQKAMQYQPHKGSRLRESSRMSTTSTAAGSELDEEEVDPSEYDPKNPSLLSTTILPQGKMWEGHVDSFEEWKQSVSTRVSGLIEATWNEEDTKAALTNFDQNMAEFDAIRSKILAAADEKDDDNISWMGNGASEIGMTDRVKELLDNTPIDPTDEMMMDEKFDREFAIFMAEQGPAVAA
ncbi:hypothetical protein MMC21_003257 [Puttea exsequens]|nr:hypothetical protein [Puttea exsequens]